MSAGPNITLSARYVLGFPIIGRIEGPPVFRPMAKHSEPVQVSTLLGRSEHFIDSLISRASKALRRGRRCSLGGHTERRQEQVHGPASRSPLFDELFGPG
eukprot:13512885-Heterocapsa_arctica.AAC.1